MTKFKYLCLSFAIFTLSVCSPLNNSIKPSPLVNQLMGGIKKCVTKSKHGVKLWKQTDWEHGPNERQTKSAFNKSCVTNMQVYSLTHATYKNIGTLNAGGQIRSTHSTLRHISHAAVLCSITWCPCSGVAAHWSLGYRAMLLGTVLYQQALKMVWLHWG